MQKERERQTFDLSECMFNVNDSKIIIIIEAINQK